MSIPFSDTPPSLLFHKMTLQSNSDDTYISSISKDAFPDIYDNQIHTITKSLPLLPHQQKEVLLSKIPNSNRVYHSPSALTSNSSINNRKVLNEPSIINSRSSSIGSANNRHSVADNENSITTKEDTEEYSNMSVSPNAYGNDTSEENALSSSKKSGSTEKNYDLSYFFQEENFNEHNPSSDTSSLKTTTENYINGGSTLSKEDFQTISNSLYRARSLSIGSIMSSHFISNSVSATTTTVSDFNNQEDMNGALNNKDNATVVTTPNHKIQQFFKRKTDKSNKKSCQHFEERNKIDVSVKEIKREGLKALLYSTVPLGYFLYHLLNEYCSENLFFYLAVENYQNYNFSSELERQQVAYKISKSYLTRNSELEVNLEDQISRKVKKALIEQQEGSHESTKNEFDLAKRHVFSLLNVKYYQFRTSSIWNIMDSKCSDPNSMNQERSQVLVVNLLLSYIKRNNSPSLSKLVHSFCKIYLPVGYESQASSSNISTKEKSYTKSNRARSRSVVGSEKKGNGNFISSKIDTIFFKSNKINR